MGSDWSVWHPPPPPPYLVIYSLSPGDDRLGTEDIQLETCNYLAAVSNIVSQQFLVSVKENIELAVIETNSPNKTSGF